MKKFKLLLVAIIVGCGLQMNAQTSADVISKYFENTGGIENWKKLQGIKMSAIINQQGMEIPLEIIQLKGGNQMTIINFQGKQIYQGVFDGTTLWNTNFMTQKAEKSDKEATDNMMLEKNDFPDPFLNYKEKGYTVELLGEEAIDGTQTFKIKLVKEPITVDGKKEDNITYYFFDKDNFVPIAVQSEIKSGPYKGQIGESKFSDYQEVEGIFFPFSMSQGFKGQPGQAITMSKIEINPKVDPKAFKFPEETPTNPGDKN